MWSDERGIALPMVGAVSIILFIFVTIVTSQSLRNRQMGNLYQEMVQVNYAAESGIALMQARLRVSPSCKDDEVIKVEHVNVKTVIDKQRPLYVRAVAYGRFGVKKCITAQLDPVSYCLIRWIE